MSFEGFSDFEIQKINTGRTRKPDVKIAKNIPCHTKVRRVVAAESDENHNKSAVELIMEAISSPKNDTSVEADSTIKETVMETIVENVPSNQPEIKLTDDRSSRILDFELQRKLMEEQNKMKRSLLQDAISKHAERTQADAKKLNEIKSALDQLDSELSNDVAILRKQIETATLHFNQVEKNYNAIERSFLKAKQELYQVHEKKEMLTEHLYTIIAHNEDRKAKRLSELMERVGLNLNEKNGT